MNYLYISPEFPPNYKNFILELARAGVRVFGIGEADFYSMPEDLRASLAWYARCDMNDRESFLRAADGLVHGAVRGPVDVVESHNEHWMSREALLNERFGVEGIRPSDMPRLRKKFEMKRLFAANGIPVAEGCLFDGKDFEACPAFARKTGFPLVLKPNEGVGAYGVVKVDDESQLAYHLGRLGTEYVLEKFINGRIVTYDGLTDRRGDVVFENSLIYGTGVLENVLGQDTFLYTTMAVPPALAELGRRTVKLFGIRRKFFHFEFFEADGRYTPLEINARPPGGPILDMMNYSADTDLYRAYVRMLHGAPLDLPGRKKYIVGYAGRKDKAYLLSHEEVLARHGCRIVEQGENPPLYWSGMGRHRYIFRSTDEDEVLNVRDDILELS